MVSLPEILLPKYKHFGLSVEKTVLRAVELDDKGRPQRLAEAQIPPDTFVDGVLSRTDVFITSIKNLMQSGKISTPYVAVCFPEVFAYTRGYSLPKISVDDLHEAISWKAKELFPFPEEEIYFDWKLLNIDEQECKLSVVAVTKKVLDPLVSALVAAGLKPLRFEPDASALTRLLILKGGQHALLVDVSAKGAYVTLVEENKALFTTVITCTNDDTATTYLANIDSTLKEIDVFYRDKGILTPDNTCVYITGDMANEKWVTHLRELLGYPASMLQTQIQRVPFNKSYAAASQAIAPPRDEHSINLLPIDIQQKYDLARKIHFYEVLLGRVSVGVFILCMISTVIFLLAAMERTRTENDMNRLRNAQSGQQNNLAGIYSLNAQAKAIVALSPLRKTAVEYITAILELLTEDIQITQIDFDDAKLQFKLSGTAKTRDALLGFKQNLDASGQFIYITLPLVSLETPVQVPFILTFVVKS
ncbi:hypothetical protein A2154_02930 [Candidatus Gottesmanbacteria bacterium RBG_16_43_7]|uniref:Uncharacterized protein n=1 Tax=Candidatus Gottesmanbacteria bacterium RBG_16_43_7 TaxID=1798373 RepID=A0A1F5Z967_9BACT|nr:MAG: hypothetical protein A2154_02930 [Candidatus Gottesmanbacteria bacterium RBG_16_43_7]